MDAFCVSAMWVVEGLLPGCPHHQLWIFHKLVTKDGMGHIHCCQNYLEQISIRKTGTMGAASQRLLGKFPSPQICDREDTVPFPSCPSLIIPHNRWENWWAYTQRWDGEEGVQALPNMGPWKLASSNVSGLHSCQRSSSSWEASYPSLVSEDIGKVIVRVRVERAGCLFCPCEQSPSFLTELASLSKKSWLSVHYKWFSICCRAFA